MAGGKRFAGDFQRIDAVKPNDKMLIQDSADGNVKFAFPAQITTINGWKTVESVEELPLNPMRKDIAYVVGDDMYFWVGTGGDTLGGVYQKANIFKGGDGETPHIHFAYANSADGYNDFSMTESANRAYMGIYADYAEEGSTDPTRYTWVRIQGAQGTPSYVHVAYAESADGSVGFSLTDSLNKPYLGIYVDSTKGALDDPAVYKWTLIKGSQGLASYVHIAYANSADGEQNFSTTTATGRSYLGTYASTDPQASTNPSDYAWMLTKGEQGEQGEAGEGGAGGGMTVVYHDNAETYAALEPNTMNVWGYISELSVSLVPAESGMLPIYALQFNTMAGEAFVNIEGVKWVGIDDGTPIFSDFFTTYIIWIINGFGYISKKTSNEVVFGGLYRQDVAGETNILGTSVSPNIIDKMYVNGESVTPSIYYNIGSEPVDIVFFMKTDEMPANMFNNVTSLVQLVTLNGIPKFTTASYLFNGCTSLEYVLAPVWDMSQVTSLRNMFMSCNKLQEAVIDDWDVSRVTDVQYMFSGCNSLQIMFLRNWNISKINNYNYMFWNCYNLTELYMAATALNANASNLANMFKGVRSSGVFYYNPKYDYSKITEVLPTNWSANAWEE